MTKQTCPQCGGPGSEGAVAIRGIGTCPTCGEVPPQDRKKRRLVILGIPVVICVALFGIARSQFLQFEKHNTHIACTATLKAWYLTQREFHERRGMYDPAFANVSFNFDERSRYAYFAVPGPKPLCDGSQEAGANKARATCRWPWRQASPRLPVTVEQLPLEARALLGLSGTCPRCEMTAACAANVDGDDTLDVWIISTGALDLKDLEGHPTLPGMPSHLVDDFDD